MLHVNKFQIARLAFGLTIIHKYYIIYNTVTSAKYLLYRIN